MILNTLKTGLAILMLASFPNLSLHADATADVWKQMYKEAASDAQRRMVMIKIMELKSQEFGPLLQTALDDLYNRQIESGTTTERAAKIDLCRLLIRELGNLKAVEAAPRIYAIYNEINDPLLRYECAIALGAMRANDFAFKMIRDLADLNLAPDQKNPRPKEIQAFGLVQGLDTMHLPQAYEPLFLASAGWYSNTSRVKEIAKAALIKIAEDPSERLIAIIGFNDSVSIKYQALEAADNSKATADKKADVARAALRTGLDFNTKTAEDGLVMVRLRKKALSMLVSSQDHNPATIPLVAEIISRDRNDNASYDETLQSIAVTGSNASDAAANLLNDRLEFYNERQRKEINTPRDKVFIREIIAAIKRAKNPLNKTVLFKTANLEIHDAIILREARDALATFGN